MNDVTNRDPVQADPDAERAERAADMDAELAGATDAELAGDEKDREMAELRRQLDDARNPAPTPTPAESTDPRDQALAELRAELAAIRSTPEGAAAEMGKALAALTAEVERMKAGKGLVPVPEQTDPDPYLYVMRLACGDLIDAQHPHATHHHCDAHGTVPVKDVWPVDHRMYAAA